MTATTVRVPAPAGTLSPAPRSRALAAGSLAAAIALLFTLAIVGGSLVQSSAADGPGQVIGWLISTAGLVLAGGVVWMGALALRASLRSGRQARTGDILGSRASADKSRQDALITLGLGVALAVIVALVLLVAINNGSIQKTFLRWELMAASGLDVVKAFGLNIWIAVIAEAFVLVFGLVLALARMLPGRAGAPIRALAIAYIDVMRAIPAIIVLYLIGFGLPLSGLPIVSDLDPTWFAIIALTLTYSAYAAETYRAGIESIHPSQGSASRSLGFSYAQTLRYVILPQAVRSVIPPMLGLFIALQKDTSLVNIIGAMDAFNQAKFYASSNFNLSSVTVVAVLFIIITIPQTRFVDWMLARGVARRRGGKS